MSPARSITAVAPSTPTLLLAETFGPTFQGEGPSCGQQALFVRLSRCNLSCPACDTPYTWDWTRFDPRAQTRRATVEDVAEWILSQSTDLVVITGGEPLLQQDRLIPLVARLATAGRRVEVETNGTVAPVAGLVKEVSRFNVSPKLATFAAVADADRRIDPLALEALLRTGKAVFKFVVTGAADLDEVQEICADGGLSPVWVMPEGTTTERILAVMREVADPVLAPGWHLTPRLHVLLWGDTRGR
jgi:organic radical activating enzyme